MNSYSYGNTGNLTAINSKDQTFDNAGKLKSSRDSSFKYDTRNNRNSSTSSADPSKNIGYEWSIDNLLNRVQINDADNISNTVEYNYDSSGLLKSRKEDSETNVFVWDTNREIPVILSDGEYEYIYKTDDRIPFAQVNINTDEVEYLHSDLNGSIITATDSKGKIIDTIEYSPYGETSDNAVSNFGYAGEWIDKTTGYSYNKARWYDISTGTFLSEDPLVQLTNNAFGYTEGNPLTQIDPLGLFSWSKLGDWVYENSTRISIGLTGAGIMASATGLGAPVGLALAGLGSIVSGYSAHRDFRNGDIESGALNVLGAAPGVGILGLSARVSSLTSKSRTLVNTGVIKTRRESLDMTRKHTKVISGLDNSSIGNMFATGTNMVSKTLTEKGENECA